MKRYRSAFYLFPFLILLFLANNVKLSADDKPLAPVNVKVDKVDMGNNKTALKISWTKNSSGTEPEAFYIYAATKLTDDKSQFRYVDVVKSKKNKDNYTLYISNLHYSNYSFYITAVNFVGEEMYESDASDIVHISISESYSLRITSEPLHSGNVNQSYQYMVKAETNADCDVLYRLDNNSPQGMTISNTGVINWTPTEAGSYTVSLRAYLSCDTNTYAVQSYTLKINEQEEYYLRFKSNVALFVKAGTAFIYNLKAETNADCPIIYSYGGTDQPPSGLNISNDGKLTWTPSTEGVYLVKVKATLQCDTTVTAAQSILVIVEKEENYYLRITSHPELAMYTGEQFIYNITTETNADCPINYSLDNGAPQGMTISDSGKVSWTPAHSGVYEFTVRAKLSCDNNVSAVQRIRLVVRDKVVNTECATIYGHLTDRSGHNLNISGRVRAFRVDPINFSDTVTRRIYYGNITNGLFSMKVAQGTYIIRVNSEGYEQYWYNNAHNMHEAQRMVINCGDSNAIVVSLTEEEHEINLYTVTGSVKSASDNTGLRASVEFIPVDWLYNADRTQPMFKYVAETDVNGNYSIMLPDAFTYIAHAVPAQSIQNQYADQYYNGKIDPMQADLLHLTSNLTNINFYLGEKLNDSSNTPEVNGFSGRVLSTDGVPVQSKVIAYLVDPRDNVHWSLRFIRVAETDATGHYSFSDMIPGRYVVLSIPYDLTAYVPGYYSQGTVTTLNWNDATRIEVGDVTLPGSYDIIHAVRTQIQGLARLEGLVTQLNNSNFSIAGAIVIVLDDNHQVAGITFTDDNGHFAIENLQAGNYTLAVDKIGFAPVLKQFALDYQKDYDIRVDVQMSPQEATGVNDNPLEPQYPLMVYPNPASSVATVQFNSEIAGRAELTLFNQIGGQVFTRTVDTQQGMNSYNFDVNDLPSGLYLLRIQSGGSVSTVPVNVIR